jgi:phage shock protein A
MVKIGEAAAGIGSDMAEASLAVRRANEQTAKLEARAAALDELVSSGVLDDPTPGAKTPLERELEDLSTTLSVDGELEHLRAELDPPPNQQGLTP